MFGGGGGGGGGGRCFVGHPAKNNEERYGLGNYRPISLHFLFRVKYLNIL